MTAFEKTEVCESDYTRRVVGPPVTKFAFKNPALERYARWGWHSLKELNRALRSEQVAKGHTLMCDQAALFQSFWPHALHYKLGKDPKFTWIIVRMDQSLLLERGDIVFCPFPTVTEHFVVRTKVEEGDDLYVPARWGEAVLDIVGSGYIALETRPRENAGLELPFEYLGLTAKGERIPLTIATGLAFAEPPRLEER